MPLRSIDAAALLGALPAAALANCATDVAIARYVSDWQAGTPTRALAAGATLEDALCSQRKLIERLGLSKGRPVGHKAGLTSAPAQERFGVEEPVRGVLLEKMLLDDGARVPAGFGARPLFEADLLLVVGSEEINGAETREQALAHISAVRPFIELPDLAVAQGEPITGATLTAGNVGARLGVMGAPIPVGEGMLAALEGMTVRVTAADGEVLSEAQGSSVLGHPVESLLWLLAKGVTLAEGDLVSVGSIGPLMPPEKAKGRATVTYLGLPGDPTVSVAFTE